MSRSEQGRAKPDACSSRRKQWIDLTEECLSVNESKLPASDTNGNFH